MSPVPDFTFASRASVRDSGSVADSDAGWLLRPGENAVLGGVDDGEQSHVGELLDP